MCLDAPRKCGEARCDGEVLHVWDSISCDGNLSVSMHVEGSVRVVGFYLG